MKTAHRTPSPQKIDGDFSLRRLNRGSKHIQVVDADQKAATAGKRSRSIVCNRPKFIVLHRDVALLKPTKAISNGIELAVNVLAEKKRA